MQYNDLLLLTLSQPGPAGPGAALHNGQNQLIKVTGKTYAQHRTPLTQLPPAVAK
jgi:hypothetical protein